MFRITQGKGFHMHFANGWTISVQFGPVNYCANHGGDYFHPEKAGAAGSATAEIAIFNSEGEFHQHPDWGDTVEGYLTPDDVLKYMNWTAKQKGRIEE